MPLVLRAHALWKSYAAGVTGCSARVWVLRGASLDVEEGECVVILGARGAGTTTLLHCLAGLRRPDAGTIEHALPSRFHPAVRLGDQPDARTSARLLLLDDAPSAEDREWPAWSRRERPVGTAVIATHVLSRVRDIADRVLLLRDGRLTPLDRASGVRRVAEAWRG